MTQHTQARPGRSRQSIRDRLDQQARARYPELAQRLRGHKYARRGRPRQVLWQDRILMALCAVLLTLFIVRTEVSIASQGTTNGAPRWGLQLESKTGSYVQLAMDTDIQIDVTGLIARVAVTQAFSNHDNEWAEGTYRFPLPQGAAVDRLRIKVGERILEGEIQEKQRARRAYQQARDNGQTATLVEQQRRNQFETRLANIGPGETIEITISYLQNVSYRDASYELRIPLTFTPRWQPPGQAMTTREVPPQLVLRPPAKTRSHALRLHANLLGSVEYAAIRSRNHDIDIRHNEGGYHIEIPEPGALSDRDFVLEWTPALASKPAASLMTFNDGQDVYAQLMLAPPLTSAIAIQAREVIMIIDTSGSMQGASLTQARSALIAALASLGPDDYFNLVQFNSQAEALFERSLPVGPASLARAQSFIRGLRANGGTNMAPALERAFSGNALHGLMRQVVFITDGGVSNESDLLRQVALQLGDSRLFTVAIGSAPNSWFMRKAAEIGRGSHVHIGDLAEVETQISALWERIRLPALTDICVDWGGPAEYYPEVIPDLYAGEPVWLVARLESEPTAISLCGTFNDAQWNLDVDGWDIHSENSVVDMDGFTGGENLAILWARKKIEALEDSLMFGADNELTKLEITALALDYGLLTRHTSLVAVERTLRRDHTEMLARSDIPGLLPAGTSLQVAPYPATATGWPSQLLLSLLVLLLSGALLFFSGRGLSMANHSA